MSDEKQEQVEDGFTFVDKRRTVGAPSTDDAAAYDAAQAAPVADDSATDESTPQAVDDDADESMPAGMDGVFGIASYAIGLLSMSAWQYLGLVADPKTNKATRDLRQARIAIDCVAGMVDALDKNSGAVDPKTLNDIKRVLNDLRLNFVTQTTMSKEASGGNAG